MQRSAPSASAAPMAATAFVDPAPRTHAAPSTRALPIGPVLAVAGFVAMLGGASLAPPPRAAAQPPCVPPPPGMVAWYPLDEPAGATTVVDIAPPPDSLVNNSGTTLPGPLGPPTSGGGAVPVVGQVAGAHYFYSAMRHEVAPQAELDFGKGDFSIDAWIRDVGNGQKQAVVDKLDTQPGGQGWALYFEGWFLHLNVNGTTFTSVAQISHADPMANTGPWYHIAATVQRAGPGLDTALLYIDGAPSPWFVPPTGSVDNTLPMWIGNTRLPVNPGEIAIDELEIFNRALTGAEVNDLYLAGPSGKCRPPLGHFTATPSTPTTAPASSTPTPKVDITYTPTVAPLHTPFPIDFDLYLPIALVDAGLTSSATALPRTATAAATTASSPTASATATPAVEPTLPRASATATDATTPGTPTPTTDPSATAEPPTPEATTTMEPPTATPAATPGCAPQPPGMAAWWPLDEPNGTWAMDAVGANHGTVQGGAAVANPAKVGPGRMFDGATGLVVVPSAPALDAGAGDFSIDAWINPASDAQLPIVTKLYAPADAPLGYAFSLEARQLTFRMSNEGSTLMAVAPGMLPLDGGWHLVAVTVERGSTTGGRMYADGALVHTFDTTPLVGPVSTTAELHIAEQPALGRGLPQQLFGGGIDEVELFHRALTEAEIRALYDAGALGKCDKPGLPMPLAGEREAAEGPARWHGARAARTYWGM